MFTGIITNLGTVSHIARNGTNADYWVSADITGELKIDQSIAHNGVCLTVVDIRESEYKVTAVAETLQKTTLNDWQVGDTINLELALRVGDRLDGHFVQGHVDAVATCIHFEALEGSWLYTFSFPENFAELMIEKGSVCLNGVSLTAFNVGRNSFTVTIIPYTFEYTNFKEITQGSKVNIEFDVMGKYLVRRQALVNGMV